MQKIQIINFLVQFVVILGNLFMYALIGRIIVSYFVAAKGGAKGRFSQLLYDVTDPVLKVARLLPHSLWMLDFSPLIALIGIDLLTRLIISLLYKFV